MSSASFPNWELLRTGIVSINNYEQLTFLSWIYHLFGVVGRITKKESEKAGLKLHIKKTKIMASGPITSWQIEGEIVEAVFFFIFWAPKSLQIVTAAMKLKDACSLEGKLWQT